jgi:hypothetical protein
MAWAWPLESFDNGRILDNEEFNANLAAYCAELDGNLSEHNFAQNTLGNHAEFHDATGGCADDIGIRLYQVYNEEDPHSATSTHTLVPQGTSWRPVPGISQDIVTTGGKLFVFCSFQIQSTKPHVDRAPPINFCLGVDGQPMMDTILGTGDSTNEAGGHPNTGDTPIIDIATAPGFRGQQEAFVLQGAFDIEPGARSVQLFSRHLFQGQNDATHYISQHELIVLFLWA